MIKNNKNRLKNKKEMKRWIWSLLFVGVSLCMNAQTVDDQYEMCRFISAEGDTLPYRRLQPQVTGSDKKAPLVIFLHGIGERGRDNKRQLTHCGQAFLNPAYRDKYPAYVLFPQCPSDERWVNDRMQEMLKELIESYLVKPGVDRHRVYIIGISMGGIGTYELVSRYPELFTAAVPICGRANVRNLWKARDVKFRIFHGDNDPTVSVEGSREAYKALKAAGADVNHIEFAGCGHESWYPAFNYPDFMEWLFSQKKR